jgi:hypothetical protein
VAGDLLISLGEREPMALPAVKEVETPDAAAILDRVAVKPSGDQLPLCHHPMLPSRQAGDQNVGCAPSVGIIATRGAHPVYVGASGRPKGAPPPIRHTLNAQFVNKASDRRGDPIP